MKPRTFEEWRALYPKLLEYVECGWYLPPGWTELVDKLCRLLSDNFPEVRCVQCKSKFGGLRFYLDVPGIGLLRHDAFALELAAEAASYFVCAHCGGPRKGRRWDMACENCTVEGQ